MEKILFAFGLVLVGLAAGYLIQVLVRKEVLRLPISLDRLRRGLQRAALLWIHPIPIVGAIWIVKLRDPRLVGLPFLGAIALLLGGLLALAASHVLNLSRRQTGAFFACGSFSNTGSVGGFVCFVLLGEAGFAFAPIYRLFEEFIFYVIGFPIAKSYSTESPEKEDLLTRVRRVAIDPFTIVPMAALMSGGLLNVCAVPRPEFIETVNAVCIPLGMILLLISIGLAMRITRVHHYVKECFVVSGIKFVLVPAAVTSLAALLGYGALQAGLPLKVVLILSSMPVAFTSLVPPSIYDLDLDLANACWLFTTALLVIVVPVLFLVINLM